VDGASGGINLTGGCKQFRITNNFIWGGDGDSCRIGGGQGILIQGNTFANAGQKTTITTHDAILLTGSTTFCIVRDNFASNFPTTISGGGSPNGCDYGIRVGSSVADCVIENNFLEMIDDAPLASTHFVCTRAGISVDPLATNIKRWGNRIIMDQYRMDCPLSSSPGSNQDIWTCLGLRNDSTSADRHNQVVGVMVTGAINQAGVPPGTALAGAVEWKKGDVLAPGAFTATSIVGDDEVMTQSTGTGIGVQYDSLAVIVVA
jgi:hypothetical protein